MKQIPIWVLFITLFVLHVTHSAVEKEVKKSLISFLTTLNGTLDPSFGWNMTTDPCQNNWKAVSCSLNNSVRKIVLDGFNLSGAFDAASLCSEQLLAASLAVISLQENNVGGPLPAEIANCKRLSHIFLRGNQLSGNLPESLPMLNNLKRLDISFNNFLGNLPDLSRISGLRSFIAEYNQLSGRLPEFNSQQLQQFNVSFNNFSGPVPDAKGRFGESSFMNNSGLCGYPLPNPCPSSNNTTNPRNNNKINIASDTNPFLMYSGHIVPSLAILYYTLI